MNISIGNMEDLFRYGHLLPHVVLVDIDKRIGDWLASGGSIEDSYIKQQFRYAERFIKKVRKNDR
ncbi:MAG: hypothetical protein KZY61_00820 [Clostridiaceae bacterium]|nr:hypothetical protein [Clostridiaceae bacterium]MBW4860356.1 hypothetical protein [Clostridiaceae bacterium]MBW4867197.1 hypothetical protein [Clostridiaceae bacterium]